MTAFRAICDEAMTLAQQEDQLDTTAIEALEAAATEVARSWSRSNLGYQANVYYAGFAPCPAGATFSREWGFTGMFNESRGDWCRMREEDVVLHIRDMAGNPDTTGLVTASDIVRSKVEALIERARSEAAKIPMPHDSYVSGKLKELESVQVPTSGKLAELLMSAPGNIMVRDMEAVEGGWRPAGHQIVIGEVLGIQAPFKAARWLAEVSGQLDDHLEKDGPETSALGSTRGTRIFVGHGGSTKDHFELGNFLTGLGLEWEVFDRKPTAGMSTKERLLEMLDNAQFAFLIMTGEDETADGKSTARANVIHEVGLFQGRLGWSRAIVLLEDGCEEFSNIEGIGQIRYPRGTMRAAFNDIREVLAREGVI